jgi:DNA-binding phage protein
MARGRWNRSDEMIAREAYAVLINGHNPSRKITKTDLARYLSKKTVYGDFLKFCLEFDGSKDLREFRKGLLLVVKAIGPTQVADKLHFSRVTLYRMLSPGGNPRLKNHVALIRSLGLHLWLVDEDFMQNRRPVTRPKDEIKAPRPQGKKWRI